VLDFIHLLVTCVAGPRLNLVLLGHWESKVLLSPQRSSVRVNIGFLNSGGSSPPIAQFGRVASSRKSLGGSKSLPFKND
jgi:hypothetical protein